MTATHLRPDEFAAVVGEIVKLGDVPISEALAFYREHVTTMDDRKPRSSSVAPLRRPIRPIKSDILHPGPPSRWDSSPESVSGEEALLHDIP